MSRRGSQGDDAFSCSLTEELLLEKCKRGKDELRKMMLLGDKKWKEMMVRRSKNSQEL